MLRCLRSAILALLVLLPAFAVSALPAQADRLTFWVKSNHHYSVSIEFSSSKTRYWPGNGKSWSIDDYEAHKYVLTCRTGESICYGAWEPNGTTRWGLGYRRDRTCSNCCYTCNGDTETRLITLAPPR